MSLKSEGKKIRVMLILEVLGKPKEHLVETLNQIIEKIATENGVEVKEKKVNEPSPLKAKEGFFTDFAEVEVEVESLQILSILMFKFMPAFVEILSPERITLQNNDINDIFNSLMQKLHGYDEVARILQTEKIILEKRLKEAIGKKN